MTKTVMQKMKRAGAVAGLGLAGLLGCTTAGEEFGDSLMRGAVTQAVISGGDEAGRKIINPNYGEPNQVNVYNGAQGGVGQNEVYKTARIFNCDTREIECEIVVTKDRGWFSYIFNNNIKRNNFPDKGYIISEFENGEPVRIRSLVGKSREGYIDYVDESGETRITVIHRK
jgi:hypothetical protein